MPRIRSLKPELPSDEKLNIVSLEAELTFVLLITQADDEKLVRASDRELLGALFPHRLSVTGEMVRGWVEELVAQKMVRWRRTKGGAPVLELVNFLKHQKIDKKSKSKIRPQLEPIAGEEDQPTDPADVPTQGEFNLPDVPPPPREALDTPSRDPREGIPHGSGSGAGSLKFDHGGGAGSSTASGDDGDVDKSDEEDQSAVIDEFVKEFYCGASVGRQRDVRQQMHQLFARNGATYQDKPVWAADVAHVRRCLMSLRNRRPTDPDAAIVFLFLKLRDTYTEATSARYKREEGVTPRRAQGGGA